MLTYFPDEGLIDLLSAIAFAEMYACLFTNNVTIGKSTVYADLVEAAWTGYSRNYLAGASWISLGVAGHVGSMVYPSIAFSNASGGSVTAYGFFMIPQSGTDLLIAGNFDGAPVTILDGGSYVFIPTMGDLSFN
jgi:hypothetical protein